MGCEESEVRVGFLHVQNGRVKWVKAEQEGNEKGSTSWRRGRERGGEEKIHGVGKSQISSCCRTVALLNWSLIHPKFQARLSSRKGSI